MLLTLFLFAYLFVALLNTSIVQSLLAVKLSDYFSKEWKTEVEIGAISINIFDGVEIKDVYLESQKGDTILFSESISVKLFSIPTLNGIRISNISIEKTTLNVETSKKGLNFQFILDYFKSDKPKEKTSKKPFVVEIDRIKLRNIDFRLKLKDNLNTYAPNLVAINNMHFSAVDADFQNIEVINDSVNVTIKKFQPKKQVDLR